MKNSKVESAVVVDVFDQIQLESDRVALWKTLQKEAAEIHLLPAGTAVDSEAFSLKIESLDGGFVFMSVKNTQVAGNSLPQSLSKQGGTLLILCASGMYRCLAKTEISVLAPDQLKLQQKAEIGRLQRRGEFRNRAPMTPGYQFRLLKKNGTSLDRSFHLVDVSVGGLSFRMDSKDISAIVDGDQIEGLVCVPGRTDLKVKAILRHHAAQIDTGVFRVGLQFLNLDRDQKQELLAIGLHLYRLKV